MSMTDRIWLTIAALAAIWLLALTSIGMGWW